MSEFPLTGSPRWIGLAGDWHGNWLAAEEAIHRAALGGAVGILHLGDFGIWGDSAGKHYLGKVQAALRRHRMWLGFVDGNHEDFTELEALPIQAAGTRRVRPRITHLPRGLRWTWHGQTWLALGGATSIDRPARREWVNWWPQEAITWQQAEQAIAGGAADYMITHDAPARCDVPGLNPDLWQPRELRAAEQHRELLQQVVDAVGPRRLWHGHMHVRYTTTIATPRGSCVVDGLDCNTGRTQDNLMVVDLTELGSTAPR